MNHTDSYIPSTREYQVLQKYFPELTFAITDPVRLAADLFKAELMSDSTRIKANNGTSSKETRNHHILNELMIAVTIDPTNLMKIVSVLQGHRPFLSAIAKKMMTDYGNKIIIVCINSNYILHSSIITFPTETSTTQSSGGQPATGLSTSASQLSSKQCQQSSHTYNNYFPNF